MIPEYRDENYLDNQKQIASLVYSRMPMGCDLSEHCFVYKKNGRVGSASFGDYKHRFTSR